MKPIKKISSKIIYKSNWMTLREDDIQYNNGNISKYGVIERAPFVLVIPFIKDEILLVKQYRYPVDKWTLEFPQGGMDDSETPEVAARRELKEETGFKIKQMKKLGHMYEAAGFATHDFWIFKAEIDEYRGKNKLEESESGLSAEWYNVNLLKKIILDGEIEDCPTAAAFSLFLLEVERGEF